jgi:hypothetical protein
MHYLLLPLYFCLQIVANNYGETDLLPVTVSVLSLLLAVFTLRTVVAYLMTPIAAGLVTNLIIVLFFTFADFVSILKEGVLFWIPKLEFQGTVVKDLSLFLFLLEIGILLLCIRKITTVNTKNLKGLSSFLNAFAIVLVVFPALSIAFQALNDQAVKNSLDIQEGKSLKNSPPNIYHIVLDGYGRADVLVKFFEFNNGEFIRKLNNQGFNVLDTSWANYSITQASLAATLNLDYLNNLVKDQEVTRSIASQLIRNNRLVSILRELGYQYFHLGSIWEATLRNPNADRQYPCTTFGLQNEFLRALISKSWLILLKGLGSSSIVECHRNNFINLKRISESSDEIVDPFYVFSHIVLPHYPYVFDDRCQQKFDVELSNAFSLRSELWNDRASYLQQLQCVNKLVLNAVKKIVANDPRSVIIIHSDHGPDIPHLDNKERISARLANFIAVKLPKSFDLDSNFDSPIGLFKNLLIALGAGDMPQEREKYFYIAEDTASNITKWQELDKYSLKVF